MRRRVSSLVAVIAFVVGAIVMVWPVAEGVIAQQRMEAHIRDAFSRVDGGSAASADEVGDSIAKRPKAGDRAYEYLLDYNERVRAGAAGGVNDPWGIGSDAGELADAGLPGGIVGSVAIPRMGVILPVYLGASDGNMARGAGLVAGTSAPLGEATSHCVIAAHRGMANGSPMFRDIEDLEVGDVLTVDTPWDSLVYRLVDTRLVSPRDVDSVNIQPHRDIVTLLTCHPYGAAVAEFRYLAVFERVGNAGDVETRVDTLASANPVRIVAQAFMPSESPNLVVERWMRAIGLLITLAALSYLIVVGVGGLLKRP